MRELFPFRMGAVEEAPVGATNADLTVAAEAEGHVVSSRSLELWRYRGLLPRQQRRPGGRAVWRYPAGTERQLARLLHWRERARSHGEILIALWIEGFPIELRHVRTTLVDFVAKWKQMIERETDSSKEAGEGVLIDQLARKLARMRGRGAPFPHLVRMRLSDRERAFGYLIAAMFGMEEELAKREEDIPRLERMLGMRSGRDGGLSSALGLVGPGGDIARLPTPGQALEAVTEAVPEEFELVRRMLQIFLGWLPVLLPVLFSEQAVKSVHLLDLSRELLLDPPPAALTFFTSTLLVLLHSQDPSLAELSRHLRTLEPELVQKELGRLVE